MATAFGSLSGCTKSQSKDGVRNLPAPIDYSSLSSALLELGVGMRKAVETCLDCWKVKFELVWLFLSRFRFFCV